MTLKIRYLVALIAFAALAIGGGVAGLTLLATKTRTVVPIVSVAEPAALTAAHLRAAMTYVRWASVAIMPYHLEHGTYAGATEANLQANYDTFVRNVSVKWGTRTRYCIESKVADASAFTDGPDADILPGTCPAG